MNVRRDADVSDTGVLALANYKEIISGRHSSMILPTFPFLFKNAPIVIESTR